MLKKKFEEADWYHPEWYDQALSSLYEGIWLESATYSEAESKLYRLGYFPDDIRQAVYSQKPKKYNVKPRKVVYKEYKDPAVRDEKRVDKKLSKERKQIKEIQTSLASEIAFARQRIQNFLKTSDMYECDLDRPGYVPALVSVNTFKEGAESTACFRLRVEKLEKEYDVIIKRLNALTEEVRLKIHNMEYEACHKKKVKDPHEEPSEFKKDPKLAMAIAAETENVACYDDYEDYMAADEVAETIAADQIKEELEAEYDEQSKKIPKSQYVLDLLTPKSKSNRDMMKLTHIIRGIKKDGLRIRATKILAVQYGVRRLQVICVVEDEKFSLPELRKFFNEKSHMIDRVEVVHIKKL